MPTGASRRFLRCVRARAAALRALLHHALLACTARDVSRSLALGARILCEVVPRLPRALHQCSPSSGDCTTRRASARRIERYPPLGAVHIPRTSLLSRTRRLALGPEIAVGDLQHVSGRVVKVEGPDAVVPFDLLEDRPGLVGHTFLPALVLVSRSDEARVDGASSAVRRRSRLGQTKVRRRREAASLHPRETSDQSVRRHGGREPRRRTGLAHLPDPTSSREPSRECARVAHVHGTAFRSCR